MLNKIFVKHCSHPFAVLFNIILRWQKQVNNQIVNCASIAGWCFGEWISRNRTFFKHGGLPPKRVNVLLPAPQNKGHRLVRCPLFCDSGGEPLNPALLPCCGAEKVKHFFKNLLYFSKYILSTSIILIDYSCFFDYYNITN